MCPASAYLLTVGHKIHWAPAGTPDGAVWFASVQKERECQVTAPHRSWAVRHHLKPSGVTQHKRQLLQQDHVSLELSREHGVLLFLLWGQQAGSSSELSRSHLPTALSSVPGSGSAFTSWKTQSSNWAKFPKSELFRFKPASAGCSCSPCEDWEYAQKGNFFASKLSSFPNNLFVQISSQGSNSSMKWGMTPRSMPKWVGTNIPSAQKTSQKLPRCNSTYSLHLARLTSDLSLCSNKP